MGGGVMSTNVHWGWSGGGVDHGGGLKIRLNGVTYYFKGLKQRLKLSHRDS